MFQVALPGGRPDDWNFPRVCTTHQKDTLDSEDYVTIKAMCCALGTEFEDPRVNGYMLKEISIEGLSRIRNKIVVQLTKKVKWLQYSD